jgi:hypothetical protein
MGHAMQASRKEDRIPPGLSSRHDFRCRGELADRRWRALRQPGVKADAPIFRRAAGPRVFGHNAVPPELTPAVVTNQPSGRSQRVSKMASARFFRRRNLVGKIHTGASSPSSNLSHFLASAIRAPVGARPRSARFGMHLAREPKCFARTVLSSRLMVT